MPPRTCACLDADARACYDLRYYGRTPVLRGPLHYDVVDESVWRNVNPDDDDECDCLCHELDEDGRIVGWDRAMTFDLCPDCDGSGDGPDGWRCPYCEGTGFREDRDDGEEWAGFVSADEEDDSERRDGDDDSERRDGDDGR